MALVVATAAIGTNGTSREIIHNSQLPPGMSIASIPTRSLSEQRQCDYMANMGLSSCTTRGTGRGTSRSVADPCMQNTRTPPHTAHTTSSPRTLLVPATGSHVNQPRIKWHEPQASASRRGARATDGDGGGTKHAAAHPVPARVPSGRPLRGGANGSRAEQPVPVRWARGPERR